MLSDIPRRQLAAIYVLESKIADDDKLCEAFLRDYCAEYRREIAALAAAVRWGVPKSLREGSQVPPATLRANLARRLEENQGLDLENAFWAVDTWALVLRPANAGWPAASPADAPAPEPSPAAPSPVAASSHQPEAISVPQASSPQYSPGVSAGVLSPPPSVPNSPLPPGFSPPPLRTGPQPMPGIPFSAAASAFLAGEKNPELKAVQGYLKQQLKIRKPASLMGEIQAAGVAPGIAKSMVNRVRRNKALLGLALSILILMIGFVMLGTGTNPQGEVTGIGTMGFFVFFGGCGYALFSVIRIVRFS